MANTRFITEIPRTGNFPRNPETPSNPGRKTRVIKPKQERMGTERTVNILLLDASISMNEKIGNGDSRSKFDGVKESASTYTVGLPSSAYLSVISYSDYASVLFPLSEIGNNKLQIIEKTQSIPLQNSTDMIAGLECAEQEFRKAPEGFMKRLVLLTDGLPNQDPSHVAERLKASGVQITTIGFGESKISLDEELLRRMASISQKTGTPLYYYISDAKNLTGFLKRTSKIITM